MPVAGAAIVRSLPLLFRTVIARRLSRAELASSPEYKRHRAIAPLANIALMFCNAVGTVFNSSRVSDNPAGSRDAA